MVRIRELHRDLGRVLDKTLGEEVSGDEEEAPQHRRPKASTCRQWAATTIVEDIEHVDDAADEAHEEPHNPVTKDVDVDSQSFPSEPQDISVLTSYVDHVVAKVYLQDCTELKLASHGRTVEKLGRPAPEIEGLVAGTSHTYDAIDVDQVAQLLVELLGVTTQEVVDETK
ncbi:hypothetical protein HKD37_20G056388 [Glycine soja]